LAVITVITITHGNSVNHLRIKMETYRDSNKVDGDESCVFRSLALLLENNETEHNTHKERAMECADYVTTGTIFKS
jgi:hypothetical protein